MALPPERDSSIPEETASLARKIRPKGSLVMTIRDTFGPLFNDAQFARLFASTGQVALSPGRLALICVLQTIEGLSDRQAAEAVALRIDWKYALDLPLDYPGFCHTVLHDFRERLLLGGTEEQLLNCMLQLAAEKGWLDRRRQRTDSTHILAVTAALNRFELIHQTVHASLTEIATHSPEWLQNWVPQSWYRDYAVSALARRWPKTERERLALAAQIGADGAMLLERLEADDAPVSLLQLQSVHILRLVWQQQYREESGKLLWRNASELPSASERLVSPYESEARTGAKRDLFWDGYKVHLTETITTEAPQLITQVETAPAYEADSTALPRIQEGLRRADVTPEEQVLDSGYVSAALIGQSRSKYGIDLVGPVGADNSWQAQSEDGLDIAQFVIDWEARVAFGPAGCVSSSWSQRRNHRDGTQEVLIRFPASSCKGCQLRERCTRSAEHGRTLTVREQHIHEELLRARARQKSEQFQSSYRQRAGIEGTLSQGLRSFGLRRSRYCGQAKTHLHNILVALAINLVRIVAWVQNIPRSTTRLNPFAALAPAPS
jgi:transposase